MKKIITAIFAFTLSSGLYACGSSSDTSSNENAQQSSIVETTEETTSIKDTLDTGEKSFFDALIDYSPSLKNPSSIRVAEVKSAGIQIFVRITGENGFGGTGDQWLVYEYDLDTKRGKISNAEDFQIAAAANLSGNSWDINKINKALNEYFNY